MGRYVIKSDIYLCWRKLSWRLKYFPQISQENVNSGLLWVRSWIIKLYGLVKRRWQNLHTNSHFGRILRRKSDRRSSLSIRITANIFADFGVSLFLARHSHTTLSFLVSSGALNLLLKCVLNGLLTWYSCNPLFCSLYGNFAAQNVDETNFLIRWCSCHSNKFYRMKVWKEWKRTTGCKK